MNNLPRRSIFTVLSAGILFSALVSHANPLPSSDSSSEDMCVVAVGFDLALDHTSAAINCVGGSSYDVTSIDGSDDYAATMRRLTDNAVSKSPILESNARYLQSSKWADDYDPSKSKKHNDMINLGAIFGELRSAVEARLTVPISSLAVSVPAITSLNASTISAALETVGLQDLQLRQERINAASAALGTAEAKLQASDAPEDPNVLVLEYHSSALVSSFFPSFSFSSGFGTPHARTVDETAGATAFKAHIFSNDEACSRALRSSALVLPRRLRRASFGNQIDVVMVVGQDLVGGAVKEKVVEAFEWWSKRRGGWPKPIVFEEQETGFAAARGAALSAARALKGAHEEDHAKGKVLKDAAEEEGEGGDLR